MTTVIGLEGKRALWSIVGREEFNDRGQDLSRLLWPNHAEGAFDPSTHSVYPAFVHEDLGAFEVTRNRPSYALSR